MLVVPVNAQQSSLGTLTQNQDAKLIQTCAYCTYNNITSIILANKTILQLNVEMTKNGNEYTYILPATYTSSLGQYKVNGIGDADGIEEIWNYEFNINPLGVSQSTSQGLGSSVYLGLMIVLMFTFGYLGFRLAKTDNWWVMGIFFMFLSWVFLVYNTFLGYQYHRVLTGLSSSAIPERIFWALLMLLVLGLLVSIALLFLKWRKILRYVKKEIKRKEADDQDLEDWDFDRVGGRDYGRT